MRLSKETQEEISTEVWNTIYDLENRLGEVYVDGKCFEGEFSQDLKEKLTRLVMKEIRQDFELIDPDEII